GPDEEPVAAARREFREELGVEPPDGRTEDLGEIRQKGGKLVRAWALEGDLDATAITSNTFALQWPPRSGEWIQVPEVDRAEWFALDEARERMNPAQTALLDRLPGRLTGDEALAPRRRSARPRTTRATYGRATASRIPRSRHS